MPDLDRHPSDEELLLAIDDEFSAGRADWIYAHALSCSPCRARIEKIEQAMDGFEQAYVRSTPQSCADASAQARLRARLATSDTQSAFSLWWQSLHSAWAPRMSFAVAVALLAVAVLGALVYRHSAPGEEKATMASFYPQAIPDRMLTPGATREVSLGDVCSMAGEEVVRAVPAAVRKQVLQKYGIAEADAGSYEIDYLITPGLGGADDIRNLWPQPYNSPTWNAYVKDSLEAYLHQMVCSGNLDLAAAQQGISTDWIVTYKEVFRTEHPLPGTGV